MNSTALKTKSEKSSRTRKNDRALFAPSVLALSGYHVCEIYEGKPTVIRVKIKK